MELDDLKNAWNSLERKGFEPNEIRQITNKKFQSNFGKLLIPEILLTAFNLYFVALIFFRFDELDTGILPIIGAITILILLAFPVLRIYGLVNLYLLGKPDQLPANTIEKVAIQKIRFQKIQKINMGLAFFLLVAILVLAVKIYNEYDVTQGIYFWLVAVGLSLLFVFIFRKISKKYQVAIEEAEVILSEMKNMNDEEY